MKKRLLVIFTFLPLAVFSQTTRDTIAVEKEITCEVIDAKVERKNRPTYLNVGIGLNNINFRDFATSPLIYSGSTFNFALAKLKMDSKKEINAGMSYSVGGTSTTSNDRTTASAVHKLSFNYSRLYHVSNFSNEKWNVMAGGLVDLTTVVRINESLFNNAIGADFFGTLFGSAKVTRDVSRTEEVDKKFLFWKRHLKPRKKNLSFRLNVGLMNNTYRNDYIYLDQAGLVNENTLFSSHIFKAFSGMRFSTALDYTLFMENKNALRFSYEWDAYKTGGDLDKFEMANHQLSFTLLFNTK